MTALSSRIDAIFRGIDHRPWPLSAKRWQLFMRWSKLAFLHWPIPVDTLAALIPAPLKPDIAEGSGWVGVVPFQMEDTQFRGLPKVPTAASFAEINVRTYVTYQGYAGVWFFSLDAASRLAVWGGRTGFNLPYHHAKFSIESNGPQVQYHSERTHRGVSPAEFKGMYQPVGPVIGSQAGSLEHWLTERYCLFSRSRRGKISKQDVHHRPWPLQLAQVDIQANSMAAAAGIQLPEAPPLAHYAEVVDVVAWGAEAV